MGLLLYGVTPKSSPPPQPEEQPTIRRRTSITRATGASPPAATATTTTTTTAPTRFVITNPNATRRDHIALSESHPFLQSNAFIRVRALAGASASPSSSSRASITNPTPLRRETTIPPVPRQRAAAEDDTMVVDDGPGVLVDHGPGEIVGFGAGADTGAGVTRPKTDDEEEADRLFEERMEEMYAMQEGGA